MAPRHRARIAVTGAPAVSASPSLIRGRRETSCVGLVLAIVALLVQIAGPGLHAPSPIRLADHVGTFAVGLDPHALCRAPDSPASLPRTPADKTPKADHDFSACCAWHAAASAVLAPVTLVEPVAFAASRVAYTTPRADIPARLPGAVRARAPPARA